MHPAYLSTAITHFICNIQESHGSQNHQIEMNSNDALDHLEEKSNIILKTGSVD